MDDSPHLVFVIKDLNVDLKMTFDLNNEPAEVPSVQSGSFTGALLSSILLHFVIQACLESLEKAMQAEAAL